ncbi:hypothetical protein BKA69DRAFT_1082416 [Paraphysoderma sedebokerense]|nr:hypothetical protein BKA69DRAFT_1082416 [Paraphysoderma sedebokerense]
MCFIKNCILLLFCFTLSSACRILLVVCGGVTYICLRFFLAKDSTPIAFDFSCCLLLSVCMYLHL